MALLDDYHSLIHSIAGLDEVMSIGKSGGEQLPEQNESDIDIFVFCNHVPEANIRKESVSSSGVSVTAATFSQSSGRFWGTCDYIKLGDTEICFMYFTMTDIENEIASVLNGSRLDREDEYFYPTGRCATFLSMHVLCDKNGFIAAMKEKLSLYPKPLSKKLFEHHIAKINDEEDFQRAVSRNDVLFFHSTLDSALDHFLQALFAVNQCFFPSRKRSLQYIAGFQIKPLNCPERLVKVIELGSKAETLPIAYKEWSMLCADLMQNSAWGYDPAG